MRYDIVEHLRTLAENMPEQAEISWPSSGNWKSFGLREASFHVGTNTKCR
jgi:hypothetical protein